MAEVALGRAFLTGPRRRHCDVRCGVRRPGGRGLRPCRMLLLTAGRCGRSPPVTGSGDRLGRRSPRAEAPSERRAASEPPSAQSSARQNTVRPMGQSVFRCCVPAIPHCSAAPAAAPVGARRAEGAPLKPYRKLSQVGRPARSANIPSGYAPCFTTKCASGPGLHQSRQAAPNHPPEPRAVPQHRRE